MNLLAFLWLVGCVAACIIAYAVPSDVWQALAHRIRNPRPSAMELYYSNSPATIRARQSVSEERPSKRPSFPVDDSGTEVEESLDSQPMVG